MKFIKSLFFIMLIASSNVALAATSSSASVGGLTTATTAADNIRTALYALVGSIALIYMIYIGVMAFTEKKTWADFGWAAVHVSAVGGAVVLGSWAWGLFTT